MKRRSAFSKLGWKGLAILSIAYLVLPLDLIPDLIPMLGFADDLTVLAILLKAAICLFLRERRTAMLPVREEKSSY